jgi:hypothetical protein
MIPIPLPVPMPKAELEAGGVWGIPGPKFILVDPEVLTQQPCR